MNTINWNKYVDYIFCLNYLQNNRREYISNVLTNIGININDSRFFSFIYDYEHCIFEEHFNDMQQKTFEYYNNHTYFSGAKLNNETQKYIFYLGLTTYRALKIAQYFNYERIIIFEDDIMFLKDINYIIDAMNLIKQQEFDICMCQTTFIHAWHGIKEHLINYGCENINNMFLKSSEPAGVYGGGFLIVSKSGINKIIKYFETNNFILCIDSLDPLKNKLKLNTIFALKPLCVQRNMIYDWDEQRRNNENINIKLEDYI